MEYETFKMARDSDLKFFEFDILSRHQVVEILSKKGVPVSKEEYFEKEYYDVDEMFNAIYIRSMAEYFNLPKWGHVDTDKLDKIWYDCYVSRNQLSEYAQQYYGLKKSSHEMIDFMLVDMLLFAELLGLYEYTEKTSLPKYKYNFLKFHQKAEWHEKINSFWYMLIVFCVLWFVFKPLAFLVLIGMIAKFAWYIYSISFLTKRLNSAIETYNSLKFKNWNVIWEDMHKSRRDGVIWDKLAFDIVQRNLKN